MEHNMVVRLAILALLLAIGSTNHKVLAFTSYHRRPLLKSSKLYARSSSNKRKSWTSKERNDILSRNGEYFKLNRMNGDISFGSSSRIQTKLDGADMSTVQKWLSNDEQIAMSIWDEKLITKLEPKVYRLKLMTLMFVTIQLAPHVDVNMYTDEKGSFNIESVAFDPNIQILPGVGVSADSLGILIDVVGELYPSKDGKGVDGKIGFVTSGNLPPPMRLLPEPALKGSLSTINRTITNFAVSSFQSGARAKFREFMKEERK